MSPRWNWDSPTPPLASECAPPPGTKGEGATRLRVRGWGSPNSDDWRKSLALCLLYGFILHLFPSTTRVLGPAHVLPRGNFTLGSISGSATPSSCIWLTPRLEGFFLLFTAKFRLNPFLHLGSKQNLRLL